MGTSAIFVLLTLLGFPLFLLGALVLVLTRRPHRRGKEPHCRKCEYLLVGIESSRCPECGSELVDGAIVRGQPVRPVGARLAGLAMFVIGGSMLIPLAVRAWNSLPWIKITPDFLLMRDIQSPSPGFALAALDELIIRDRAGGLSNANHNALVQLGLKEQASSNSSQLTIAWIDWLGDQYLQDRLPQEQKNQFMDQIVNLTLRTRAQIAPGDSVLATVFHSNRAPSNWWIQETGAEFSIDGKRVRGVGGSSASSGLGAGGSTGISIGRAAPGQHEVSILWPIHVFQRPHGDESKPVFKRDRTLTGAFLVLESEPAGYITGIDDPSLFPAIKASLTPAEFTFGDVPGRLRGHIEAKNLPADISFEVFARIGQQEYPMGAITGQKGSSTQYVLGSATLPDPGPRASGPTLVTVILRSSEKPVRNTVDQTKFWKGELIYPLVPVRIIGSATQP